MVCIDQLLKRALNSEKIVIDDDSFMAEELLALFLKKVMELPSSLVILHPLTGLLYVLTG